MGTKPGRTASAWIRPFRHLWKPLAWGWVTIVIGVGVNVGSTWLITQHWEVDGTPLGWLIAHPAITLPPVGALLVLTGLSRLASVNPNLLFVKNPHDLPHGHEEEKRLLEVVQHYPYDVAFSYAGEDRNCVDPLAAVLKSRGVKLFYDRYEKPMLWGKNLYTHLSDLYQNKASYCVIFLSQHYATKLWTKLELQSAQARALSENEEYILPVRLDNTDIPGFLPTIAYLNWREETVETIADAIMEKLDKDKPS